MRNLPRILHTTMVQWKETGEPFLTWPAVFCYESKLPKKMWPYAVMTAAYVRNRCYNPRVGKTPFEAFSAQTPNISGMHVFGSVCFAYVQDKKKLDARGEQGVFVGYDKESPAYLVYFPAKDVVRRVRCVRFTGLDRHDQYEGENATHLNPRGEPLIEGQATEQKVGEVTRINEPVEANAKNADATAENARYPQRERRPPVHFKDYVTDQVDFVDEQVHDFCYRISAHPQTYREAVQCADSVQWKSAMEDEMSSLKESNTFTLTPLPEGRKAIGGRWVYDVKESADGSQSHKARFVAKGYSQVEGVDFGETFAPTASLTSVRVLMQLAAQNDLILHQMDVKTAYLNAPIDCELYMEQAEGFEVPG